MRVSVPTINDRSTDFDRLIDLWNNAISTRTDVIFDFSECGFLRQNAVACLGGLARMIQRRGKNISFATTTMSDAVRMNLAQNGFLSMCNVGTSPWQGNSIPYREDQTQCTEAVVDYLRMQWLGRGWVSVSPGLRDAIVGVVWEIYANAFEHSRSPVGVISCGQFYPTLQLLKLAVLDCGVGIPNTVRAYKSSWQIPADRAVKWAFQRGASTRPGPGGMGLDVLKEFIRETDGCLEVYSHEGRAEIARSGEAYERRGNTFPGTLVNITIGCQEAPYQRFVTASP